LALFLKKDKVQIELNADNKAVKILILSFYADILTKGIKKVSFLPALLNCLSGKSGLHTEMNKIFILVYKKRIFFGNNLEIKLLRL